jgi:hypothetical protein
MPLYHRRVTRFVTTSRIYRNGCQLIVGIVFAGLSQCFRYQIVFVKRALSGDQAPVIGYAEVSIISLLSPASATNGSLNFSRKRLSHEFSSFFTSQYTRRHGKRGKDEDTEIKQSPVLEYIGQKYKEVSVKAPLPILHATHQISTSANETPLGAASFECATQLGKQGAPKSTHGSPYRGKGGQLSEMVGQTSQMVCVVGCRADIPVQPNTCTGQIHRHHLTTSHITSSYPIQQSLQ